MGAALQSGHSKDPARDKNGKSCEPAIDRTVWPGTPDKDCETRQYRAQGSE